MARINFSQVEERLVAGIRKMFIHRLLEMADSASRAGVTASNLAQITKEESDVTITSKEASRRSVLAAVQTNLKRLIKTDRNIHEKLGISHQEFNEIIDNPGSITPEEWEQIKNLKEEIEAHSTELSEAIVTESMDEKTVEAERLKHIYKRFNVREGWLPLH